MNLPTVSVGEHILLGLNLIIFYLFLALYGILLPTYSNTPANRGLSQVDLMFSV